MNGFECRVRIEDEVGFMYQRFSVVCMPRGRRLRVECNPTKSEIV